MKTKKIIIVGFLLAGQMIQAADTDLCAVTFTKPADVAMALSKRAADKRESEVMKDAYAKGREEALIAVSSLSNNTSSFQQLDISEVVLRISQNIKQTEEPEQNFFLDESIARSSTKETAKINNSLGELTLELERLSPDQKAQPLARLGNWLRVKAFKIPVAGIVMANNTSSRDQLNTIKREISLSQQRLANNNVILKKSKEELIVKIDSTEKDIAHYEGMLEVFKTGFDNNDPVEKKLQDAAVFVIGQQVESLRAILEVSSQGALSFEEQVSTNNYTIMASGNAMNTFTAVFSTILIQQNTSEQARLVNEQSARMRDFQNRALIAAGKATVASAQAVAKNMAAAPISIEAIESVRAAAIESRRIIADAVEKAEKESAERRERLKELNAETRKDVRALVAGKSGSALPALIQEEKTRRELTVGND